MSKKFFSVKHRPTETSRIVKAPNPALAIVCLTQSDPGSARPFDRVKAASDEQVFEHTAVNKLQLHSKSRERADGLKLFVVPHSAEEDAGFDLIRAKNPDDAYSLITEDEFEVVQLGQEELLDLVGSALEAVVEYTPPPKRTRAKKVSAESSGDAGTTTTNGAAPGAEASTTSPAAGEPAGTDANAQTEELAFG